MMGLLSILLGSYVMAIICKEKWLKVLPPFVFCIMLLTYLLGIMGGLDKIWLLKWGIVIFCVLMGVSHWRKHKCGEWKIKNRVTVAAVIFACVSIMTAFLLKSHVILEWDDLSHWAITIKQMFYINEIPGGANALSRYNDYQPISALFSYWFLSDFREFHEYLLFPIYFFSVLICLVPFYEKIPTGKANICRMIFAIIICLLLPGAFASTAMVNLKVDSFVTVLFIYIVVSLMDLALHSEQIRFIDLWKIICALCVMVLSKSIGIYLAVTATVILLTLVRKRQDYTVCALGVGAEIFFNYSWKIFCRINGNTSYISAGFRSIQVTDYLETMKDFLTQMPWFLYPVLIYVIGVIIYAQYINKDKVLQKRRNIIIMAVIGLNLFISLFCRYGYLSKWFAGLYDDGSIEYVTKHYIYYFYRQSVTFQLEENVTYGMSALECIMLIGVIMLVAGSIMDQKKFKMFSTVQNFMMTGFVIYVIGQLAMYRYMFVGPEASVLSAYSRYIMMYLGGWVGGNLYLIFEQLGMPVRRNHSFFYCVLLTSMFFLSNIPYTFMCIFQYHENYFAARWEHRLRAERVVESVRQNVDTIENGIWISCSGDSGWMRNECSYHFAPEEDFVGYWVLDRMAEDELRNMLEKVSGQITYLVLDTEKNLSEESKRKIESILSYFQLEEKEDGQIVYTIR